MANKGTFFQNIFKQYTLEISEPITFNRLFSMSISRFKTALILLTFLLILTVFIGILVVFTPVKKLIPGYPSDKTRLEMKRNALRADSLLKEMERKDRFFRGIKNIIAGKDFDNIALDSSKYEAIPQGEQVEFSRSHDDSIFRANYEAKEKYNIQVVPHKKTKTIGNILFYPPMKGIVSTKFSIKDKHFGIDIIGKENSRVSAILEGTVMFTGWTLDAGYVLQIQHNNNLISIYKHNAKLLKKEGEYVKSGEAIALLGNSGELTSGPHLHFEIWYNGKALNPENYIKFQY